MPAIASREQKVWWRMWMLPVTFSPASRLLRPPHREQAETSSANIRRSSPAQSKRGVRSLVDSTVAAWAGLSSSSSGSAPA